MIASGERRTKLMYTNTQLHSPRVTIWCSLTSFAVFSVNNTLIVTVTLICQSLCAHPVSVYAIELAVPS